MDEKDDRSFMDSFKVKHNEQLNEEVSMRILRIQTHIALNNKKEADREFRQLEELISQYGEASLGIEVLDALREIRSEFNKRHEKNENSKDLPPVNKEEFDRILEEFADDPAERDRRIAEYMETHRIEPDEEELNR